MGWYVKDIYLDKLMTLYPEKEGSVLLYPREDMAPTRFATLEEAKQAVAQSIQYGKIKHMTTMIHDSYQIMSENEVTVWILSRQARIKRRGKR